MSKSIERAARGAPPTAAEPGPDPHRDPAGGDPASTAPRGPAATATRDGILCVTVRLRAEPPSWAATAPRTAEPAAVKPQRAAEADPSPTRDPRSQIALIDGLRFRRDAVKQVLQHCVPGSEVLCYNTGEELRAATSQGLSRLALIVICTGGEPLWDHATRAEIRGLCRNLAQVPVVVLSDREGDDDIAEACRLGVRGFLPTSLEPRVAREVLHYVRAGGSYLPAGSLTRVLMGVLNGGGNAEIEALPGSATDGLDLTPRQRQVLELLCLGKPNKVIAYELGMEEGTVKVHVRHIMRKLGASNRTEVLLRAQQASLIAAAAKGSA